MPAPATCSDGLSPNSIRIDIFQSLEQVEAKWREAQEHCDCYGFQTFEWLSTWHETIGVAERINPQIVHITDAGGNTLMLLPLAIQRRFGLSFLTFLGGAITDYNAPIIRADFATKLDDAAIARLMSRTLARLPKVDVIAFERLPSVIDGTPNPLARLTGAKQVSNAWVATLGSTFADFKKRRSTKFFSKAARGWRRLTEIGATRLCIADTPDSAAEMMRAFVRQKRRRWREIGSPDLFAKPGHLAFYSTLAESHLNSNFIQISALRVGETIVATHWGMVFRNRFYWLMPTYEAGDWARLSVGRLLMQSLLEWSIAQGIERFDLTIGDEAYKQLWADHVLPLNEYVLGLTARGKAYRQVRSIGGRMRKRAGQSERLRQIATIWRRRPSIGAALGRGALDPIASRGSRAASSRDAEPD